ADLLGNRNHRCPARRIFPAMLQHHPYRPGAHLGGELVRCLAHQALSYLGVRASDRPGAVQCASQRGWTADRQVVEAAPLEADSASRSWSSPSATIIWLPANASQRLHPWTTQEG